LELLGDGGGHARRTVTDIQATDAAGKVDVAIAIHVFNDGSFSARGEYGRGAVRAAGDGGFAAGHQGPRLWSRNFRAELNGFHNTSLGALVDSEFSPGSLAAVREIRDLARDDTGGSCD
jgi:hypothetical protein